jgi:hypothetical protein
MIIRQVGAKLFYADRQAEKTKLILAFHNFANWPNKIGGNFACMKFGWSQKMFFQQFTGWSYLEDLSVDGNIA